MTLRCGAKPPASLRPGHDGPPNNSRGRRGPDAPRGGPCAEVLGASSGLDAPRGCAARTWRDRWNERTGGTNGRCGGSASVMDGISMQSSRDEFVGMNDLDLLKEGDLPIGTIEHHH